MDASFGPLSREECLALAHAPGGEALKAIRVHDPLFGLAEGEKHRFLVTLRRRVTEEGSAEVEAATQEEAEKLAAALQDGDVGWNVGFSNEIGEVVSVEPSHRRSPRF